MSAYNLRRLPGYSRSKSEVCCKAADRYRRSSRTLVSTVLMRVDLDQVEKQLLEGVTVYIPLDERCEIVLEGRVNYVLLIQIC